MADILLEAIQALPPIPTDRPLSDEPTRAGLKEHGFDLSRWVAWWDQQNEAGTICRHFRQDQRSPKTITGPTVTLGAAMRDSAFR